MLIVDTVSAAGTPLWLIILTSGGIIALGTVLGTLLGNLLIGWQTAKREDRRWAREDEVRRTQWEREEADRRERWAHEDAERDAHWLREDALRTFEQRRDSYTQFYVALQEMTEPLRSHYDKNAQGPYPHGSMPMDWQRPAFRAWQQLRVYGAGIVEDAAADAYVAAGIWGDSATAVEYRDGEATYQRAEDELLKAIRYNLRVPEDQEEP